MEWSKYEIEMLKSLYPEYGAEYLSSIINRSKPSIKNKAYELKIKTNYRKSIYKKDEKYFENIDSGDKAYWLGFITADGYVVNCEESGSYELGIELSAVDERHLKIFLDCINSNTKIKRRSGQNFTSRNNYTVSENSLIRIHSKKIVSDLSKYEIVQNKTKILNTIPNIGEYTWDYIRGYFDGDGTFSYTRVKSSNGTEHIYPRIGFSCYSLKFLNSLKEILDSENIISHISKDNNNWTLQIRASESVRLFCFKIYNTDSDICLERKYKKYLDFYKLPVQAATSAMYPARNLES